MNRELYLAVLSMDTYHHDYNSGINWVNLRVASDEIGNAKPGGASSDYADRIGSDQAIDFYARTYELNGQQIIAYRGTDALLSIGVVGIGWDAPFGYPTALGDSSGSQALMAARYYNAVLADTCATDVVLTGHSLGGGLAGFVGALHSRPTLIFDHMEFWQAAENAYDRVVNQTNTGVTIDAADGFVPS